MLNEFNLQLNGKKAKDPELSIYERMAQMHEEYVWLYRETHEIEALKRALFIQWYSASEPGPISGIGCLGREIQERVFLELVAAIQGGLDDEFVAMLNLMIAISEYYFEGNRYGSHLITKLRELHLIDAVKEKSLLASDLENRGQMGDYFRSHAHRLR